MAKGRVQIHRPGHRAGPGTRAKATARNRSPRVSSPEGRKERMDARKESYKHMKGLPGEFHEPGSSNVRKVGR